MEIPVPLTKRAKEGEKGTCQDRQPGFVKINKYFRVYFNMKAMGGGGCSVTGCFFLYASCHSHLNLYSLCDFSTTGVIVCTYCVKNQPTGKMFIM